MIYDYFFKNIDNENSNFISKYKLAIFIVFSVFLFILIFLLCDKEYFNKAFNNNFLYYDSNVLSNDKNFDYVKRQIQYKKDYDFFLEQKIINILLPILGDENLFIVKVNTIFDFNQEKRKNDDLKNVYKDSYATIEKINVVTTINENIKNNKKLNDDELNKLINLIQNIVGFDNSRGDSVTISTFKFANQNNLIVFLDNYYVIYIFKIFLIILVLFLFYKMFLYYFSKLLDNDSESKNIKNYNNINQNIIDEKIVNQEYDKLIKDINDIIFSDTDKIVNILVNLLNDNIEKNAYHFMRKLAIFFVLIGNNSASLIMVKFDELKINQLMSEIIKIKEINKDEAIKILIYFYDLFMNEKLVFNNGLDSANEILNKLFDNQTASKILENILGNSTKFAFLNNININFLVQLLESENEQTIALILSHLEPLKVAKILERFDINLRNNVVYRMASLNNVNQDIIDRISFVLMNKVKELSFNQQNICSIKNSARIINYLDDSLSKDILNYIEENDKFIASKIKDKLFTFNDIYRFSDNDMKIILEHISYSELMIALKGSTDELCNFFTSFMDKNECENFNINMLNLGNLKVKDIEFAQENIVKTIKKLIEQEKINLLDD